MIAPPGTAYGTLQEFTLNGTDTVPLQHLQFDGLLLFLFFSRILSQFLVLIFPLNFNHAFRYNFKCIEWHKCMIENGLLLKIDRIS